MTPKRLIRLIAGSTREMPLKGNDQDRIWARDFDAIFPVTTVHDCPLFGIFGIFVGGGSVNP